jgi:hypothetical protein
MAKFNPPKGSEVPLLPHYVYILMDPRSNNPFYVGKGTDQRALQHGAEVERLLAALTKEVKEEEQESVEQNGSALRSQKMQIISNIINNGTKPRIVVVGRYETAEEAFAVEATLIHFVFGYDELSNVASGHGSKRIRSRKQYEAIKALGPSDMIHEIEGIDIPSKNGVRDNSYKNEKIAGLVDSRAYDFLDEIRMELTGKGFNWRDYGTAEDMRFHPGEANGYLALIVQIGTIDLNIQFRATKKISIQLIYTEQTRKGTADQARLLTHLGMEKFKTKAGEKYAWLEPKKEYSTPLELVKKLVDIRDALQPDMC